MEANPSAHLAGLLARLRRRHVTGRIFYIFSLALAADLGLDLVNFGLYTLSGWAIPMPFFFEIVLTALFLREIPGFRMERFALLLDHRFSLKDRLYSFTEYAKREDLPPDLVLAQAGESLSAIDPGRLRAGIRATPPGVFYLLLPAALFMAWLGWASEYTSPGVTNRIVRRIVPHQSSVVLRRTAPPAEEGRLEETGDSDRRAARPDADDPGSREDVPRPTPGEPAGEDTGAEDGGPASGPETEGGGRAGESGGGGGGNGSGDHDAVAAPETIQSIPVTSTVSLPVPPTLAEEAASGFLSLPEAGNFLSLIPGQRGRDVTDLDREIIDNFRNDLQGVPQRYHEYLNTYYQELQDE